MTSVLVEEAAIAGWAIGGAPPPVAVHVDATITAGTNAPDEKARFIERAMTLLTSVFGTGAKICSNLCSPKCQSTILGL